MWVEICIEILQRRWYNGVNLVVGNVCGWSLWSIGTLKVTGVLRGGE